MSQPLGVAKSKVKQTGLEMLSERMEGLDERVDLDDMSKHGVLVGHKT